MRRPLALTLAALAAVSLQGCATYYVPVRANAPASGQAMQQQAVPGLSIGELLQMLQARRPQADIISDLRARGLRVAPAPADYDVLSAAGASPELMQSLQSAAAYADAQIANGGVAQTTIIQEPYPIYDTAYPWVPFGLGLGFGYFAGSAGYWGHPYVRGYAPYRPFGGGHITIPRGGGGPALRGFVPRGGFISRGRR